MGTLCRCFASQGPWQSITPKGTKRLAQKVFSRRPTPLSRRPLPSCLARPAVSTRFSYVIMFIVWLSLFFERLIHRGVQALGRCIHL